MMSIFSVLVEEVMEIFMDDFSVYGSSFEDCLKNLYVMPVILQWELYWDKEMKKYSRHILCQKNIQ